MKETRWLYISALETHLPVFFSLFLLPGTASSDEGAVEIKLKKILMKGVTPGIGGGGTYCGNSYMTWQEPG